MQPQRCPLCRSDETSLFFTGSDKRDRRSFELCSVCDSVFVPQRFHLEREAQRQRYLTHNNDPGDPAYRGFLSRLFDELRPHLAGGASGLDYGAGPGPALAAMMGEEGFSVRVYDPFFYPDTSALEARYDFITCTETAEHFSRPREDFDRLDALLKPSGRLGVMTGMLDDWEEFPDWHYRLDPTHISFYSGETMRWIGGHYGWDVELPRQTVTLFRKPAGP